MRWKSFWRLTRKTQNVKEKAPQMTKVTDLLENTFTECGFSTKS